MSDIGLLVSAISYHSDAAGFKNRPGLVIGEYRRDYLLAFISKKVETYQDEPFSLLLTNEHLISGKLKLSSIVRSHKTYWAEKSRCKAIGRVKPELLDRILRLNQAFHVRNYHDVAHAKQPFIPGKSRIPYAARVYDEKEMINLVDASLDFWLTAGRYAAAFEEKFAAFIGVKHCSLTNSGSSANLLAFMALTSPKLGDRRIRPGDEVITVAAGFPTTVSPIIQYGAVPVFVDVTLPTYNIDCNQLEAALSEKTRAVMLAHTMGNPFDINNVLSFCQKHHLWLIEDTCDALGSTYTSERLNASTPQPVLCGNFGHLSTFSFYPPHHMTMGEGGAVCTNDTTLKRLVESFRDWGRDCWCPPGKDNTCTHRFDRQFGELPKGYDHKYVYSHFGYNLKVTDMQAAIGCAQLEKLPDFIEARKRNWHLLRERLAPFSNWFILPEPTPNSDPSWFGFLLTLREHTGFSRDAIVAHLESQGIQTRMLFAGNLVMQPCFDDLRLANRGYRIVGDLSNTERVMRDSFWIGVYPGLTDDRIDWICHSFASFLKPVS